jgi:hypothetical protein
VNIEPWIVEQCERAERVSRFVPDPVDVVEVTHPDEPTRIAVVGATLSRAAYDRWAANGCTLRVLHVYQHGVLLP